MLINPHRARGGGGDGARAGGGDRGRDGGGSLPAGSARRFHARLDGYAQSALRDSPELAEAMGVGRVWLKVETERFGLPAFRTSLGSMAT